jgi:protein-S-isoprenylcysteine O-methyltransferase Ste14
MGLRVLIVLFGTGVWFGLAVLGSGGFEAYFSHPALIALTCVLGLMIVASVFAGGNLSSGEKEDRGNRWVLWVFLLIGFVDGYLPAWADRNEFWIIDGETIRWIGVALFAIGGVLRLWPVFVLRNRFSGLVAIQPGHTLVTNGIYRVIRNPSYLGALVMALGWGLAFRSAIGVVPAALLIPPLVARIDSEEALLAAHFGAEYEEYRSHTWRLIPFVYKARLRRPPVLSIASDLPFNFHLQQMREDVTLRRAPQPRVHLRIQRIHQRVGAGRALLQFLGDRVLSHHPMRQHGAHQIPRLPQRRAVAGQIHIVVALQ